MAKIYKVYSHESCTGVIRTEQKICDRRFRRTAKLTKLADLENYQLDKWSSTSN